MVSVITNWFNLIGHLHSLVRHKIIIYVADLNNINNVLKGLEEAFSDKEVTIFIPMTIVNITGVPVPLTIYI